MARITELALVTHFESGMTFPKNVRRFALLWWAAFLLGLIGIPPTYVDVWTRAAVERQLLIAAVGGLAFLAILFPFFWLTVWRRRKWARWVLLLAFVVSLPVDFFVDLSRIPYPLTNIGVGLVSGLLELAAFYFLFTGDAQPWFRLQNSK
jgi:hypothetical protein